MFTHFTSDNNFSVVLVAECFYHRFATVANILLRASNFRKDAQVHADMRLVLVM